MKPKDKQGTEHLCGSIIDSDPHACRRAKLPSYSLRVTEVGIEPYRFSTAFPFFRHQNASKIWEKLFNPLRAFPKGKTSLPLPSCGGGGGWTPDPPPLRA